MVELDFEKQGGLVPVVVQDAQDDAVLMLAYMNRVAFERTLETGQATYWSRSRQQLWIKGETSGNTQEVEEVLVDCDSDTVLLKVRQSGAACHEGRARATSASVSSSPAMSRTRRSPSGSATKAS